MVNFPFLDGDVPPRASYGVYVLQLCQSMPAPIVQVVERSLRDRGRRFDPRPRHTKGVKNGTGSSLADARNKRVVPGRYKKAG